MPSRSEAPSVTPASRPLPSPKASGVDAPSGPEPPAAFLLSFDCEGRWGVADHIDDGIRRAFTSERLDAAYQRLLAILERHQVRGTFAFVAAFTMSPEEYRDKRHLFRDVAVRGRNWLEAFRRDDARGEHDGWFLPQAFARVAARPEHEAAVHGFSHLPLHPDLVGRADAVAELEAILRTEAFARAEKLTLVYPRNLVGFQDELPRHRLVGYRDGDAVPATRAATLLARASRLLRELNVLETSEPQARPAPPVAIPAGHFLNWRAGARRFVPASVTERRLRHALADAVARGRVLHVWTHPHNFITGDHMYDLLEQLLGAVAEAARRGDVASLTQRDYVARVQRGRA